ncbi:regulatory protein TetR [Pseudonocardia dioxanivorans CB1190]|uniref:Regulatory protein TetR n=1 Tax=Pseudonocardia dioxanivorans (strain ATCC 55486 / DSM 44775 / JCM 13855 / CB1190) TaxID=675635 RepID=F4CYL4_PSEUX|nr:TetR/AcrR family transcriptional regulator [Pseudonocardia dioxanivorans]AEA26584.1 regulatory protein TetR [Pseudonocardia dioxanivorans CB1190]
MPQDVGARRGRPPISDEQRREQRLVISRQAVRLFREQGVAATSGEQIARAAGVSERTLWRWFRTKEACVEPLLSRATEDFQAVLRSWPPGADLGEHLRAEYAFLGAPSAADVADVLAVIRMTRDEPVLRAVWLVLHERAETTLAEVLGERLGLPADDLRVRLRAAAVNAALRVATEDLARTAADDPGAARRHHAEFDAAMRAALRAFDGPDVHRASARSGDLAHDGV